MPSPPRRRSWTNSRSRRRTADWLAFRFIDPSLPTALLPADWPLDRARAAFIAAYDGLGLTAEIRFHQIAAELGSPDLPIGALRAADFGL